MRDAEADFVYRLCETADVVLFKCHYQKWRLDWCFSGRRWKTPLNIMVVPHGARSDRRWGLHEMAGLRAEIGLNDLPHIGKHLVGLVGWIQSNKRWDILTSMWEGIEVEIKDRTGDHWDLLAAGAMRDPNDLHEYEKYKMELETLAEKGLAHYYEFIPRGDAYYKVMAVCDFVVIPSLDETQSRYARPGHRPEQALHYDGAHGGADCPDPLESEGGLLFTTKEMLRTKVIRLACDENLRLELGENLRRYLENVVSWDKVAGQYEEAYRLAREAKRTMGPVQLPLEF